MTTDRSQRARQAWLRSTEPGRPALSRLQARARAHLFAGSPGSDPGELAPTPSSPRRWWLSPALATASALAVAAGVAPWVLRGPAPAPPPPEPVALVLQGEGEVGGTRLEPEIKWASGRLEVRVTPHQGVKLGVSTPEARVEVVGTAFSVDRVDEATIVSVDEGKVRVVCAGQPETFLGPGETRRCLPDDPVALLLRATAIALSGGSPEDRLEAATAGLGTADEATRAELLTHRAAALGALGRTDEALAAAEEYLATGQTARRADHLAFVARTRFERDGCAAVDRLRELATAAPSRPEVLLLAACVVDQDPESARALLAGVAPSADPQWEALAAELAARVGR